MKKQFKSRKEVTKYLKEKGIDTSNWDEVKWQSINKGQADIHMMALAEAMWDAYNESTPKELKAGEWHIPFGDTLVSNGEDELYKLYGNHPNEDNIAIKIATARCARISYTVVGEEGKEANYENDIKLHDRLAASGHWSPFEHCARAMSDYEYEKSYSREFIDSRKNDYVGELGLSGNFRGFIQYRKMFDNENITK